jgi:hypothetical protein
MTSSKASPNPDIEAQSGPDQSGPDQSEKVHMLQVVLDNPWILLALGILIPAISYTAWGWIELSFIEAAQLP